MSTAPLQTTAGAEVRLAWLDPIGTDAYRESTLALLEPAVSPETQVEFASLPPDRPLDLEDPAAEAAVHDDIVNWCRDNAARLDGILIGCFFDTALEDARNAAGPSCIVSGPCEAAILLARAAGVPYSVIVGRDTWTRRVARRIDRYGGTEELASIRVAGVGVAELGEPNAATSAALLAAGRAAIDEDHARLLILGCTADSVSGARMEQHLGVPVIEAIQRPFLELERRCGFSN
ncbi:MAG: aspartate/glutamate racemase family protein [Pseudomonadota bacterium]